MGVMMTSEKRQNCTISDICMTDYNRLERRQVVTRLSAKYHFLNGSERREMYKKLHILMAVLILTEGKTVLYHTVNARDSDLAT